MSTVVSASVNEADQVTAGRTVTALDDVVTESLGRLGPYSALVLAGVIYAGLGLALPLGVGAHGVLLVALNAMGVLFGFVVVAGAFFSQIQAANRRHLLEWATELRLLAADEFEWLVGELLRREGWDVQETGREGQPDGNVDLRARRGASRRFVQCKRWTSRSVGVDEVRELAGTLMREGQPGHAGLLVTLSRFTEQATAEAAKLGIELIDGPTLLDRVESVREPEPCPACGTPMLLGRSQHGWWLRCPRWASGCSGKRDLGSEPGRAVDLLLTH